MPPVSDWPVHERTSFVEVPLSTCHSSKPDLTRQSYLVMNLSRSPPLGVPYHDIIRIKWFSDNICKQPRAELPECRGCETPEKRDNA